MVNYRLHRSTNQMRPITSELLTYRSVVYLSVSVCVSGCLLVTTVSPIKWIKTDRDAVWRMGAGERIRNYY